MSEHAKSLREALGGIMQGTPHAMDLRRAEEATRALEALLAEHRAEVSSEREEVDTEWRVAISKALGLSVVDRAMCLPLRSLAGTVSAARAEVQQCHAALDAAGVVRERSGEPVVARPLLERIAILADERNTARDAALEEAATKADEERERCGRLATKAAKRDVRLWESRAAGAETVAESIRAMQSAPAQVVPVAKVREATLTPTWADDMPTEYGAGFREGFEKALSAVRKRLGVDLDATGGEAEGSISIGTPDKEDDVLAFVSVEFRETASEENGLLPKARKGTPYVVLCDKDPRCHQFVGHGGPCNPRKAEVWKLHVFNRAGVLWGRLPGTEAELREQGALFTTVKGQRAWRCVLSKNGVPVATCTRGVWRDVSDAAGSVK
jgi:hypothetical protein